MAHAGLDPFDEAPAHHLLLVLTDDPAEIAAVPAEQAAIDSAAYRSPTPKPRDKVGRYQHLCRWPKIPNYLLFPII